VASELQEARAKAITAYTAAVNSIATGRELDDLLKYDSLETVKSVLDRLENIYAQGVFGSVPPPLDPKAKIHRYVLSTLHDDAQKLLVDTRAEAIFADAMQRGEQREVRDVLVVDEAAAFICSDTDHILNRIAKEGRKFGVMLLLASQGPGHFTDDLISAAGTKVMLGFDRNQWRDAHRMLGMSNEALEWIIPRRRGVLSMKVAGELHSGTQWVDFCGQ
jgi:DNA helicase HerA-like ATPase